MKYRVQVRLNDVERTREWREIEAETLDAAVKVAEQMEDVEVCLDARIPEGDASMTCHVNVRLKNDDPKAEWRHEWRQVEAPTLSEAMAIANKMPDVAMCLEASIIPGGVVT